VYPEQLKQGFYIALRDLEKKLGKSIKLYQTDSAGMRWAIQLYKKGGKGGSAVLSSPMPTPTPPPPPSSFPLSLTPKPPLFELGKTVAFSYLKKVPIAAARQFRIACVDHLAPNVYWFVTEKGQEEEMKTLVPFLEQKNAIKAHLIFIEKNELEDLLEYYTRQLETELEKEKTEEKESKKIQAIAALPAMEHVEEMKEENVAKDVIEPEVQATIISSEQEKGGLAGFFQRMIQNLPGEAKPDVAEIKKEPALPPAVTRPAPATPPPSPQPLPTVKAPAAPLAPEPVKAADETKPTAPAAKTAQPENADPEIGKLLPKSVESVEELKGYVKKGFIPQIVAAIVSFAIHEKASDVHVESFEDEVRIRYRVDGQLVDVVKLPPDISAAMVSRIKILSRLRLDETRVPQDGRFDVNFNDAQVDLRVSVMPTVHGEKVVMRILDKNKGISSLEALGLSGLGYKNLIKAINRPFGICLATGPTGSGKSTSLYAILNRIATPNVNVVTLEDPVEYEMKGINQSQIRPKIGFTFAEGLRSILRQDPNIIMVGEIRDGETANMATQAALTGHLVLSTLHTNDAAGAIPRLTNMGIEPFLIASSVNVAMGQRLVRKICPNCKSEVTLPAGIRNQITAELENIAKNNPKEAGRVKQPFTFYQGKGCSVCQGKGYQGRIGIYEVLMMSDEIEDLTLKRAAATDIQTQAQKEGMITMYQDGLLKVVAGLTTLDEVLRETSNK
ncbi:GspE/PulE family protein, partial [Patescibacteria group bacterium]|nr:GspE/PulE family protein [Patescibacteria group bacterium]